MPSTNTTGKKAPDTFSQVINIAEGAVRLGTTDIFGRKVIITGYPLNMSTNVYLGYGPTTSATNFAAALRGGDVHIDEASGPQDRRTPFIWWIAVEGDATGVMVGVE